MIKIIKENITFGVDTGVDADFGGGSYGFAISDSQIQELANKHNLDDEQLQELATLTGIKDIPNLSEEEKNVLTYLAETGYLLDPFLTTDIEVWDYIIEALSFNYSSEDLSITKGDNDSICTPCVYGWPDLRVSREEWFIKGDRVSTEEILPKPRRIEFDSKDDYLYAMEEWASESVSVADMDSVIDYLSGNGII